MNPTTASVTPSTWRNADSTPQKHPAPNVAFSIAPPLSPLHCNARMHNSGCLAAEGRHQLRGIERAFGRFFVFEVDEDVALLLEMFSHALRDLLALLRRVFLLAQPVIAEIRGRDVRRLDFLAFGDAPRRGVRPQ